ncbi:MAG: NAD-binding protein [Candidatus Methanosuratincola sp.]
MRILIFGAGGIGRYLIRELNNKGHEIAIMDIDEDVCRELSEQYDVLTLKGDVTNMDDLASADIATFDLVISVISKDEANILACLIAKELGVKRTIARLGDPRMAKIAEKLGITDTLCPELTAAEKVLRLIKEEFPIEGTIPVGVKIVDLKVAKNSLVAGRRIIDLPLITDWLIIKVKKNGTTLRPDPNHTLEPDQRVTMIVKEESLERIRAFFEESV